MTHATDFDRTADDQAAGDRHTGETYTDDPPASPRLADIAVAVLEGAAADRQRALAAGALDASAAIDAAGRSLLESNRREASEMADAAARWLHRRARDLTREAPRDLVAQVDRAARDHPALFIAAAALLGAAAAAGLQNRAVRDRAARAVEEVAFGADQRPAGRTGGGGGAEAAAGRG